MYTCRDLNDQIYHLQETMKFLKFINSPTFLLIININKLTVSTQDLYKCSYTLNHLFYFQKFQSTKLPKEAFQQQKKKFFYSNNSSPHTVKTIKHSLKKLRKTLINGKTVHIQGMENAIFLKVIYRFNASPIKFPACFFTETDRLILQLMQKCKEPRIVKTAFKKKNKVKGHTFLFQNLL